jgi:hypothetical protein
MKQAKPVKTTASRGKRSILQRAGAVLKKRGAKKELEAFRSVVGMWENKDTSFFDRKK